MRLAIIIPAYNCEDTICETVKSLQNISVGWEWVEKVVICDDASSDNTVQALQSIRFNRCPLTLLKHCSNKGEAACYETMVGTLDEDTNWFLILHSDDLALDSFLERNLEILEECDERVAAVSSNYYVFNESTERLAHSPAEKRIVFRGGAEDEIRHTAEVGCWWHISGSLVNKKLWQQFGGRDPELPQVGDWDLILRWQSAGYRVGHSLIPTTKYRIAQESVSSRSYLEFRDLRERTTVIVGCPRVFTPEITRTLAINFGVISLRRICRLLLKGKVNFALSGVWTTCKCMLMFGRQGHFRGLKMLMDVVYKWKMSYRWIAEFGFVGLWKRFRCEQPRGFKPVRLRSRRFGPLVVRHFSEDFAAINTVVCFDAYCVPSGRNFRSVLDLGGNIGIATRYFLRNLPDVTVLALEPSSDNCEMFRLNIKLLGAEDRVRLWQCAIGPADNTGILDARNGAKFDSLTVKGPTSSLSPGQEAVSIRGISGVTRQLPAPILLKMDIEGAENELLKCRADWIDQIGGMMIEFHDTSEEKRWLKVLAHEGWQCEKHFDTWHFLKQLN